MSLGIHFLSAKVHWKNGQQNPRMRLLCVRYNVNKVRLFLPQQVCSLKDKRRWKKKDCLRPLKAGKWQNCFLNATTWYWICFITFTSDLKRKFTPWKFLKRIKALLCYLSCRKENKGELIHFTLPKYLTLDYRLQNHTESYMKVLQISSINDLFSLQLVHLLKVSQKDISCWASCE